MLRGAEAAISLGGTVDFVLLEAPLAGAFNEGAPGLADYIAFMEARNLSAIDIFEVHHLEEDENELEHPTALQVDILFGRNKKMDGGSSTAANADTSATYKFAGRDTKIAGVY